MVQSNSKVFALVRYDTSLIVVYTLYPGKGPPVPIAQEAGWSPERVWTQRLDEESYCLCRQSNPDLPVVQSVVRLYTD